MEPGKTGPRTGRTREHRRESLEEVGVGGWRGDGCRRAGFVLEGVGGGGGGVVGVGETVVVEFGGESGGFGGFEGVEEGFGWHFVVAHTPNGM